MTSNTNTPAATTEIKPNEAFRQAMRIKPPAPFRIPSFECNGTPNYYPSDVILLLELESGALKLGADPMKYAARFKEHLMKVMGTTSLEGPIEISFLAKISDQDISTLIDVTINPIIENHFSKALAQLKGMLPDARSTRLQEIGNAHPGAMVAVFFLIKKHGLPALYQALEEEGRTSLRDKRFASDLGL